jgi:hypothetical protein
MGGGERQVEGWFNLMFWDEVFFIRKGGKVCLIF